MPNQITNIHSSTTGHTATTKADLLIGGNPHTIYFKSKDTPLAASPEVFLSAALLPSMRVGGENLFIKGKVSPLFLNSISNTIQDIYRSWDPTLHRIKINETTPAEKPTEKERVGTFFSGGVDSFYTLLKNQNEITDIIFIHGFDIRLSDTALRNNVSERINIIAKRLGKNLIEIETNLRDLLNSYVKWGPLAHGAALATIGHLLSPHFRRIFIPASGTYAEMIPWGSHLLLDPLWSTESLKFIHDGCEATRVEKVKLIAQYDLVLENLRVCWENPNGSYNCGQCEKCIRTMINLVANEALERCTTFDAKLNLRLVSKMKAYDSSTRAFIQENLDALKYVKETKQLRRALRKSLRRPVWPYYLKRRIKATSRRLRGK